MFNKYHDGSSTKFLLPAKRSANISLHSIASWYTYTLLEDNRIHASFCVGAGNEFCVILSNAKDEAWSEHKHLHDHKNHMSTIKCQILNRR
jgi:hypothetical protein